MGDAAPAYDSGKALKEEVPLAEWRKIAENLLEDMESFAKDAPGDAVMRDWCTANLHKKVVYQKMMSGGGRRHGAVVGPTTVEGKEAVSDELVTSIGAGGNFCIGVKKYKIESKEFRKVEEDSDDEDDPKSLEPDFSSRTECTMIVAVGCQRIKMQWNHTYHWKVDSKSEKPKLLMLRSTPTQAGMRQTSYFCCCDPCC